MSFRLLLLSLISISACVCGIAQNNPGVVSGKVMSFDGEAIDYAIVYLKGTEYSCVTDEHGLYHLKTPSGKYTIVFSSVGFEKTERSVEITEGGNIRLNVKLESATQLAEVVVVAIKAP